MSRIEHAISLIQKYGSIDGAHHKQWLLDQIARTLLDEKYLGWVQRQKDDGYDWDEGIAP